MKKSELENILAAFTEDAEIVFTNENGNMNINYLVHENGTIRLMERSQEKIDEINRVRQRVTAKWDRFENGFKFFILLCGVISLLITTPLSVLLNPLAWGIINAILVGVLLFGIYGFGAATLKHHKTVKSLQ